MNCTVCKKSIAEHREDRETDRCVAEKLGWTEINIIDLSAPWEMTDPPEERRIKGWGKRPKFDWNHRLPHYSSPEMNSDVWGLVERMGEDVEFLMPQATGWMFSLYYGEGAKEYIFALTAPLAICRAFLIMEVKQ